MNKVEARTPNNERNWKAIDIFLFSNGQQYSPPRKYHLQADDLNWWDSTLNYLARSHYGSLHSIIELYTIDGRKIKGPLELMDGMAYVAVVPPDAFIDSGYEKYLIKATRSWEKRQAKKANAADKPDEEQTTCELFLPCCPCPKKCCDTEASPLLLGHKVAAVLENLLYPKTDNAGNATTTDKNLPPKEDVQSSVYVYTVPELTTIKTPDDNNIAEASVMVRPQRSSTPKLDKSDTQPPLKSIIASPRLSNQRNDRRYSGQHPAFVKTGILPNTNTQQKRNSTSKGKEGFHKKMLTKIPIKVNDNVNGLAAKPKRLSKTPQPAPPTQAQLQAPPPAPPPPSPPPKSDHQSPPKSDYQSPPPTIDASQNTTMTLNDKGFTTDPANLDNLITNTEIVVVAPELPKSADTDLKSLLDPKSVIDELISCYIIQDAVEEAVQTHTDQATEKVETTDVGVVSNSDSKTKELPAAKIQQNNVVDCHIPLEDNFIAVINKGDAVSLNLTIELKNSDPSESVPPVLSNLEHRSARKVSSLSNIFKRMQQDSKDEETTAQTKSLQSVISSVNNCFAKVVVVQCACCGNNTTVPRIDTMPVYKDDNGFFILMPGPAPGENHNCACGPNRDSFCIDKKIMSELCLPDPPNIGAEFPVVTRDAGMVMTIMNCGLPRIDEWQNNLYDTYMMTKQVSINQNPCNVASCCPSSSQVITELLVSKTEQQRQMPCNRTVETMEFSTMDSFTQTEWCRVLLQVKCQADGHYTFHLPPLELLKYYTK